MKRPIFLTIWLILMLLFSIANTVNYLTYLPMGRTTENYILLIGIISVFVQAWSVIQILLWKKRGVIYFTSTVAVIFLVTAITRYYMHPDVITDIMGYYMLFLINMIMLGILYFAIRPVWKKFK